MTSLELFEHEYVRPREGRTLIVGSHIYLDKEDRRKRYPDAVGVDMQAGPGVDVVADLEEPQPQLGAFAHVECMSVLEHVKRPWIMAANIEAMMEPLATIYVAVPFVWRVHGYPDDYWRFTMSGVRQLFPGITWTHDAYAHRNVSDGAHVDCIKFGDHPHFARAEVCAFGYRP